MVKLRLQWRPSFIRRRYIFTRALDVSQNSDKDNEKDCRHTDDKEPPKSAAFRRVVICSFILWCFSRLINRFGTRWMMFSTDFRIQSIIWQDCRTITVVPVEQRYAGVVGWTFMITTGTWVWRLNGIFTFRIR